MIHRRRFLVGLLAAPAIIRTPGLLMPVKPPAPTEPLNLAPQAWLLTIYGTDTFGNAVVEKHVMREGRAVTSLRPMRTVHTVQQEPIYLTAESAWCA